MPFFALLSSNLNLLRAREYEVVLVRVKFSPLKDEEAGLDTTFVRAKLEKSPSLSFYGNLTFINLFEGKFSCYTSTRMQTPSKLKYISLRIDKRGVLD